MVALVLGWVVVAVGFAQSIGRARPDVAARVLPGSAAVQIALADRALFRTPPARPDLAVARTHALLALRRSPLQVGAWRDLALVASAQQRPARAGHLLAFAQSLSRRDLPTQLALIEQAVRDGKVSEALVHYDIVLRSSIKADATLLPVLAAASATADVRPALARLLHRSPQWRRRFLVQMNDAAPSAEAYAALVDDLRRTGGVIEPDLIAVAASRFALGGSFAPAWRLYDAVTEAPAQLLRDPDLLQLHPLPPFTWLLESGGGVDVRINQQGRDRRVELASPRGDAGPAARQLLHLGRGQYALAFRAGPLDGEAPASVMWQVYCGVHGPQLATGTVSTARAQRVVGRFDVPVSCPTQWLLFSVGAGTTDSGVAGWIGGFALTRAAAR